MGDLQVWPQPNGISTEEFAPSANPHPFVIDANQWAKVELRTSEIILRIQPTVKSEQKRNEVIEYVQRLLHMRVSLEVAYTFDAGPNAVMYAPNRKVAGRLLQRLLFYFPPDSSKTLSSYVIGDTSILREISVDSMKDVESLTAPPELKSESSSSAFPGSIDYFICTRPGKGPKLFRNEDQALLNPKTGFPL